MRRPEGTAHGLQGVCDESAALPSVQKGFGLAQCKLACLKLDRCQDRCGTLESRNALICSSSKGAITL